MIEVKVISDSENDVIWECPFCGEEFDKFYVLIMHTNIHMDDGCPLCGWKGKDLIKHLSWMSRHDFDHLILFGIAPRYTSTSNKNSWWRRVCRDTAYRCLMR